MSLQTLLYIWIAIALLLLPVQLFVTAPYGRHATRTWGPVLNNRAAWVIMESVALFGFSIAIAVSLTHALGKVATIAIVMWAVHYVHRAWIYPARIRARGKYMPVLIMLFAVIFNGVNAITNGLYIGSDAVGPDTLGRIVVGVGLFAFGFALNVWSDNRLLNLRKKGESGYSLPRGGAFAWVSCPNFLGEIIEWIGFAVLCWNLPSLGFAVWTAANLVPRAIAHHAWLRETFPDYPPERRALVPYLL